MRPARSLLIYLASIFLGGALIAPALYAAVQWGASHFTVLESLAGKPFHRYVSRSLLVIALAGLWPFMRGLGIRRWRDAGFGSPRGEGKRVAAGFFLGLGSLALIAGSALAAGARQMDAGHPAADYIRHVLNAGFAAIAVAILEELVFRGALFGALRRAYGLGVAVAISSSIYALVHFFERATPPESIYWYSGFVTLGSMLRGFVNLENLIPGFFNLALAGMILAFAFHRTGTLYFSIGLHGGWIWWLKTYGFLTQSTPESSRWFWGTNKMIDGWVALPILGLVCWWVLRTPVAPDAGGELPESPKSAANPSETN